MNEIYCEKYKKDLPSLDKQPFPGPDGEKILQSISESAWNEWLGLQTMVINELRLNLSSSGDRKRLAEIRDKFLYADEDPFIDRFDDPFVPQLF